MDFLMQNNIPTKVTFAPSNNTPKSLIIIGGLVALGMVIVIIAIVLFLFSPVINQSNTQLTISSYLHDKYGSDIEFIHTEQGGGGGIDITWYYTQYTTPDLTDREFVVRYSRKDDGVVVNCDGYLEAKFANELEALFADVVRSLGYTEFRTIVATPSDCSLATPTDDFYAYLRDPNASIFVQILIQDDPSHPIDKTALTDALISRMKDLGLPQKSDDISNTFARIEVLSDQCSYLDPLYSCPDKDILEEFRVTLEGYEDIY